MDPIDVGVRPGDVLAGKYRVEEVLGVGGMGVVVAAHHLQLDERVAIKLLRAHALEDEEQVLRFAREARAAFKIKSEHVARVIDVGTLDNGAPYIVMEHLDGEDLSGMLVAQGPMPFAQAVDFVLQAGEALAQAHALGIVHRDIKPSNLFCIRRPDGQMSIKVLDFGISKAMPGSFGSGSRDMGMTRTTAVVGSPNYMSPEQMQSTKNVDMRTDIWSIGVVLYELLTQRVPFQGDTVTQLAISIATHPAPPPSSFRADMPAALERVILRCLEKSRSRRYQNMAQLASALVEFGSKRAAGSLERIEGTLQPDFARTETASQPDVVAASATGSAWQSGSVPTRNGKAFIAIAGIFVVATLAGAGLFLSTRSLMHEGSPSSGSSGASVPVPPSPSSSLPSSDLGGTVGPIMGPVLPGTVLPGTMLPGTPPPDVPAPPATGAAPVAPVATSSASRPSHAGMNRRSPATSAPAKVNCDPPYYFDAQGDRVFKRECI